MQEIKTPGDVSAGKEMERDMAERSPRINSVRMIIIGLIGSVLAMLGDMLLMAFDTAGAEGIFGSFLSAAEQTSYTRIGLAAFFGFVGIPVSGMGILALCGMTREEYRQSRISRLYRGSGIVFCALGGGVHILCCLILTGLKKNFETGLTGTDAVIAVGKELGGALVPCTAVFLAVYGVLVVTQILLIAKGRTCLPGWAAWVNPLTLKLFLNLTRYLGGSAFANGISCSNMSLGCAIILLLWLFFAVRAEKEREENYE